MGVFAQQAGIIIQFIMKKPQQQNAREHGQKQQNSQSLAKLSPERRVQVTIASESSYTEAIAQLNGVYAPSIIS